MSKFEAETKARIIVQRLLREVSTDFKVFVENFNLARYEKKANPKSRKTMVEFWSSVNDTMLLDFLFAKTFTKSQQRTSKHGLVLWYYLMERKGSPIFRREQHLVEIWCNALDTKLPNVSHPFPTAVFVTRHILERVVQRSKVKTLPDIMQVIWPFIRAIFCIDALRNRCKEDERILVTDDAYVPVASFKSEKDLPDNSNNNILSAMGDEHVGEPVFLKTFMPQTKWSKTNQTRFRPIFEALYSVKKKGESVRPGVTLGGFILDVSDAQFSSNAPIDVFSPDVHVYIIYARNDPSDMTLSLMEDKHLNQLFSKSKNNTLAS
jgi:hypothetical protein